ncbi:MAG: hypothetical protein WBA22_08340 [Candidatus Methanofastidiosia archaeon]
MRYAFCRKRINPLAGNVTGAYQCPSGQRNRGQGSTRDYSRMGGTR